MKTIESMLEFLFGVESIKGTYLEKRFLDNFSKDKDVGFLYKPRVKKEDENAKLFSREMMELVDSNVSELRKFFGYEGAADLTEFEFEKENEIAKKNYILNKEKYDSTLFTMGIE
jgi:hypothetical protein